MGFVSDVIDGLDKSAENYEEMKESLDLLVSLAGSKAIGFETEIEDMLKLGRVESDTNLYIPITHVVEKVVQYRCVTSKTTGKLIEDVTETITSLFEDSTAPNIINGISRMLTKSLETLLGISEGAEQFTKVYAIGVDGNPSGLSIVRTDYVVWCRRLSSKSLREKMDSALSCVAYKSVIDVSKMKFDDFRSVYTKVLQSSGDMSVDDIIKAIDDAKKIFKALGGKVESTPVWAANTLKAERPAELIMFSEITPPGDEYYGKL